MAPRVFWKGYLKLSLVTCSVTMTPAVSDAAKVRFHNLNRRTGNRVLHQFVDTGTSTVVEEDDLVKGYEVSEGRHVLFEDDEIEDVGLESTRSIDITCFVPRTSVGWIWYDRPHYLSPGDKVGEEAFGVIRDAMARTGTAGVSRLVMYRRERAVLLLPHGRGLILWTLRYGDEVRDATPYFKAVTETAPDAAAARLMARLIKAHGRGWTPSMAADPVQDKLLDLIAARKTKRKTIKSKPVKSGAGGNVVSIMDALKNSIAAERRTSKS